MSDTATVRFSPTADELEAMSRRVPGLALPSFAAGGTHGQPRPDDATAASAATADPRLLLALGLNSVADGIVQTLSWSPGEVVRRSIAVSGVVAASVSRRDRARDDSPEPDSPEPDSTFEVALFPSAEVATELKAAVTVGDDDGARSAGSREAPGSREVGVVASRAIVEAAHHGDPQLVAEVAAALWADDDAAGMLQGLRARQSKGLRVRCFDGRSGRCIAGDDWFGSEHGWRRLRLGLPPSHSGAMTPEQLLDDATLSIAEATEEDVRRSLTWLTATLLRVIAR